MYLGENTILFYISGKNVHYFETIFMYVFNLMYVFEKAYIMA